MDCFAFGSQNFEKIRCALQVFKFLKLFAEEYALSTKTQEHIGQLSMIKANF